MAHSDSNEHNALDIRRSQQADIPAIETLYPAAFPDEDLLPLVRELLPDSENVLSLVATIESELVGHAVFTRCGVEGSHGVASLLGPVAVLPGRQKQGIGSALIRAGLEQLDEQGTELVCVLGDPEYYGRFGFTPDALLEPPYRLPAEWADAWQSQYLGRPGQPRRGILAVPKQWLQPALWAP